MPRRDAYRKKARECLEVAETISDSGRTIDDAAHRAELLEACRSPSRPPRSGYRAPRGRRSSPGKRQLKGPGFSRAFPPNKFPGCLSRTGRYRPVKAVRLANTPESANRLRACSCDRSPPQSERTSRTFQIRGGNRLDASPHDGRPCAERARTRCRAIAVWSAKALAAILDERDDVLIRRRKIGRTRVHVTSSADVRPSSLVVRARPNRWEGRRRHGHAPQAQPSSNRFAQAAFCCWMVRLSWTALIAMRRGFIASGTLRTSSISRRPSTKLALFTSTWSARLKVRLKGRAEMPR